ncbi:predicted protein [Plenodomus lingam JN3]|uniref:Predicted protein n=1 Tax=Leptosphaeria maculans (strain JN3 / isolate v23.1.3 / race Av1-4-5-6-7-8) TaxID=985895 RepID=E4ZWX7_LEPMJ|nr:predicted protein [Plenodomus lingam JN3]CBX96103.1 predicted protein [Plenodomus lingam JN3]
MLIRRLHMSCKALFNIQHQNLIQERKTVLSIGIFISTETGR